MSTTMPWHELLLARLIALKDDDQLPNSIALTCPPGWGHEELLSRVAMALLEQDGDRDVTEFAHPDFRWIVPDGAVIKIDQIRRLNEFAVQTVQMAPRKVAGIVDAHLLNANAANALLKTLEEPPPNTHLILATPYWGKLLPTIRSRCQRFSIAPDASSAQQWLESQNVQVTQAQLAEFGYAPLLTLAQSQTEGIDLTDWLTALPTRSLAVAVEPILEIDAVIWLGRWYRRVLAHLHADSIPNCNVAPQSLFTFADELLSVRRQIESSNSANVRLLLEHLIVRWLQLQRRASG